jgi:hypothetical protein
MHGNALQGGENADIWLDRANIWHKIGKKSRFWQVLLLMGIFIQGRRQ